MKRKITKKVIVFLTVLTIFAMCNNALALDANTVETTTTTGRDTTTQVVEVTSAGKVWMDRNLGASHVAISYDDEAAYGDLYQWGRGADGHQLRSSGTTMSLSSTDDPGHNLFIRTVYPGKDWSNTPNNDLWIGASSANNPCPTGFRLPTETELVTEVNSWSSDNSAGAFASPLKLTLAGLRDNDNGTTFNVGIYGAYWSGTASNNNVSGNILIYFTATDTNGVPIGGEASVGGTARAIGASVRCIKD